jgi:hypothetical protein
MTADSSDKTFSEATEPHTRMMKCTLEVQSSRSYWAECGLAGGPISKEHAFERAIFGSKTFLRVDGLIADLRHRYDAFPFTLAVLGHWRDMNPADRVLICHWHTQLADPIYRLFTGDFLVSRFHGPRPVVDSNMAIAWIEQQVPMRWQYPTKSMIASKMMTSAMTAGILASKRDPRAIQFPRVSDTALTYLMYVLRQVQFEGSMLANPYAASVGLDSDELSRRLRTIPVIGLRRQGELTDFQWKHDSLEQWAEAAGLLDTAVADRGGR